MCALYVQLYHGLWQKPLEKVVHGGKELDHCDLRVVSHVGDAKGFALELSIAAVDRELLLRLKCLVKGHDVQVPAVFYAAKGNRGMLFIGEKAKAILIHPLAGAVVG